MADLGDITVRLRSDIGQFQTGFDQATTSVQRFQESAETATTGVRSFYEGVDTAGIFASGSERGIRRMEFALGSLASESLGAGHALGQLGEGLLLFTGGTPVAIGILAGVFAIGEAIKLVGDKSIDATTHIDEVRKALQKLSEATPEGKFRNVEAEIKEAQRQLEEATTKIEKMRNVWEFMQRAFGDTDPRTLAKFKEMQDQLAKVLELQQLIDKLKEPVTLHPLEVVFDSDKVNREAEALIRANDELERMAEHLAALQPKIEESGREFENWTAGAGAAFLHSRQFATDMEQGWNEMEKALREGQRNLDRVAEDTQRQMQRWGDRIGRDFAQAIMNGFSDMAGLMKRIFEQVLSFALGRLLGGVLAGISASSVATGGGGKDADIGTSRVGMSGGLSLDMSKVQPLTAFAVARDPGFQELIRNAILVAHQGGFRVL